MIFKRLHFTAIQWYATLLFVCISYSSLGQILTSVDSLEQSLSHYYKEISNADILEYKQSDKYNWLYFVPSLGYDFVGHNYMISYNFGQLGSYAKARQSKQNKIKSIEKGTTISLDNAIIQLRATYKHINNLIIRLQYDKEIFETQKELFSIYEKQYENNEINHEQYLKHSIGLMQKESELNGKKSGIEELINHLSSLVNAEINYVL